MKILAIDTSTDVLGIALTEDKTLLVDFRSNIKRAHAEKLIPAIEHILSEVNLTPDQVDCYAVATGPGSFTGLRIGLAAVKGLAFATGVPVVSVPTLDAIALQAKFWPYLIRPLVKAQGDEAYSALYQFEDGLLKRKTEYQIIDINNLGAVIERKTLIINLGMKNLSNFTSGELAKLCECAPPEYSMPCGYFIALLGLEKFSAGHTENIDNLEPFYLKDFKAKKKIGL